MARRSRPDPRRSSRSRSGSRPTVDEADAQRRRPAICRAVGAGHVDRTEIEFATIDPAGATDLDQAFAIEIDGNDIVLRYAIADVGWFVQPGDPLDTEAWKRGVTVYLPDRRSPLYPAALSEGAASLLPDVDRPAVIFVVRVDQHGGVSLDGAERAVVRSRVKLAYESVQRRRPATRLRRAVGPDRGGRIGAERGAGDVPRAGDRSATRRRLRVAVSPADAGRGAERGAVAGRQHGGRRCDAGRTDRVVPGDAGGRRAHTRVGCATRRRRSVSTGRKDVSLATFQRSLPREDPRTLAFLLAVRRASGGASYAPYREGERPWHTRGGGDLRARDGAAAPSAGSLRGRRGPRHRQRRAHVPDDVEAAFERLPDGDGGGRAARQPRPTVPRSTSPKRSCSTGARVNCSTRWSPTTDDRGARIQITDPAIVARVDAHHVGPGDQVRVRLVDADPEHRAVRFERVS